jgi:DNA-binding protein H-NS
MNDDQQDTPHKAALHDLMPLIEGLELPYLMALHKALGEHIAARRVEAVSEARDRVRRIVANLGMPLEQILGFNPAQGRPKYLDPATGKTWTGKGRMPEWVKANPAQYRVQ